jgi:endonuclease/exonuclease/phosphatase family metal-dependent hydrolase
VIAEMQPDVIGLQEVIRAEGAADADQPAYLASKLRRCAAGSWW